jgi:hypothetical protein
MEPRINYPKAAPGVHQAMFALGKYVWARRVSYEFGLSACLANERMCLLH